jgi:hypothetical protein
VVVALQVAEVTEAGSQFLVIDAVVAWQRQRRLQPLLRLPLS